MRHTTQALTHKSCSGQIELQAFCIMDNHSHMVLAYKNGSANLSQFMRVAHANFGRSFNKQNRRSGKVANERPKTPQIQNNPESEDNTHPMLAHFYVEANPIRAGKVKTQESLRFQVHNSYAFYAYGDVNEFTKHLSPPTWYLMLGDTPEERQATYRKLFQAYLESFGYKKSKNESFRDKHKNFLNAIKTESKRMHAYYYGDHSWVRQKIIYVKSLLETKENLLN